MTKTHFEIPEQIDLAEFISTEAHDLKSPYNRILGFIKLVLKGMDGPVTDLQKEDLGTAYKNVTYSFLLVSNLVDMARLSRGEKKATFEEHPIQNLLEQAIAQFNKQESPKNPDIAAVLTTPEATLRFDLALMRQALFSWISYVVEYLQAQASVRIYVEEKDDHFEFSVRGEGTKDIAAPACDLTMYGFIGRNIIELHGGHLLGAEGDDISALIRFNLPKI
jgi:K+-sensing histidine kinase KdpD